MTLLGLTLESICITCNCLIRFIWISMRESPKFTTYTSVKPIQAKQSTAIWALTLPFVLTPWCWYHRRDFMCCTASDGASGASRGTAARHEDHTKARRASPVHLAGQERLAATVPSSSRPRWGLVRHSHSSYCHCHSRHCHCHSRHCSSGGDNCSSDCDSTLGRRGLLRNVLNNAIITLHLNSPRIPYSCRSWLVVFVVCFPPCSSSAYTFHALPVLSCPVFRSPRMTCSPECIWTWPSRRPRRLSV